MKVIGLVKNVYKFADGKEVENYTLTLSRPAKKENEYGEVVYNYKCHVNTIQKFKEKYDMKDLNELVEKEVSFFLSKKDRTRITTLYLKDVIEEDDV